VLAWNDLGFNMWVRNPKDDFVSKIIIEKGSWEKEIVASLLAALSRHAKNLKIPKRQTLLR
jgi:hypothetical protein